MPKRKDIKKVLVIGSGPIVIGQAAEFDYAGTQCLEALREEGIQTVLINSNPATIMTDQDTADKVYIEPLDLDFLLKVIYKERPDGILAGLGGQTALNLASQLHNLKNSPAKHPGQIVPPYLEKVEILGTSLEAIKKAEDREEFRNLMHDLNEPIPESTIVNTVAEALAFANEISYPLIIRPAYTLAGTGGGIAYDEHDLISIVTNGLQYSPIAQCLVERSIAGFKEVEYEVMRDANDNCIIVCNMENFDPVGIHTGDSIVIAPTQTLSDQEHQMLRSSAIKIIRSLKIEGGCNVQFALDGKSSQYYVIEVNPRVSRSSALASKATGYPIAKIASKIAIGYTLDELNNPITGKTFASFEPTLDYVVTKIPRWPFDKFSAADRRLGTQMKATGEVMAIGRTLEESLLKAIRSLGIGAHHLHLSKVSEDILKEQQSHKKAHQLNLNFNSDGALSSTYIEAVKDKVINADDRRIFIIADAIRKGISIEQIHDWTQIDLFFLYKIQKIILLEQELESSCISSHLIDNLAPELVKDAKRMGFSDRAIALLCSPINNTSPNKRTKLDQHMDSSQLLELEAIVREFRVKNKILPTYKMVDTCAAEFDAASPYYYSCYEDEDEVEFKSKKKRILILGSGPIQIGQGIEFDYATVHAVRAIKEEGCEAIIINNNPETVSTDFSTSDRLYFEPLFLEDVLNVIAKEKPDGIIVQFGGQTALNLSKEISKAGRLVSHELLGCPVHILGTSLANIDRAEDRQLFEAMMNELKIRQPIGKIVNSVDGAIKVSGSLGFPLLVRPSYVLGGRAMEIVHSTEELFQYLQSAIEINSEHPVLIDRYMQGKELEIDAISDGREVFLPGIMEHIERAGVHSGDSIAVYPPQSISQKIKDDIIEITKRITLELNVQGLINIQFIIHDNEVYVIEVNPRSSRTVPFLSKVTGVQMAKIAAKAAIGKTLKSMGVEPGYHPEDSYASVKVPVFSFAKLQQVEVALGPEMKSTGEVMGRDASFNKALYKGLLAAGSKIPQHGTVLVTIADKDKYEALPIIEGLHNLGFQFIATEGTARFLEEQNIKVNTVQKISEGSPNILDAVADANMIINTITRGKAANSDGFKLRRRAVEKGVLCITSLDTARALLAALENIAFKVEPLPMNNATISNSYKHNLRLLATTEDMDKQKFHLGKMFK